MSKATSRTGGLENWMGIMGINVTVGNITNAFLWKGPDYQVAKHWDNGRKSSVKFYQPTFDGNP